MLTISGLKW